MSSSVTRPLTCPQCRTQTPWAIHSSVNVTRDPALKQQVLSNELGRFTCPRCGAVAYLSQPLLYHDMDLQLMIQVAPSGQFDPSTLSADATASLSGMTTRVVATWNDLREKVLLFDAKLDDRPVELMKELARTQNPILADDEIFFEEFSGEQLHFTAVGEEEPTGFTLPLETYRKLRSELEQLGLLPFDQPWSKIDRQFGRTALQRVTKH